ncbi:MAG: phosphate butyryltransferase Ptb [Mogibacterium sp.]|nr:phosphate butyryltransferase Ptb [Mogibacterium sp.]
MQVNKIQDIIDCAKEMKPQVPAAIVSADDKHILEAIVMAKKDEFIKPYLIGDETLITTYLEELGEDTDGYVIIDESDSEKCAAKAAELVVSGEIKIVIKGLLETAVLMKALLNKETGIKNTGVVSALGVFEFRKYHKLLALTDMGINTFPDVDRKEAIIRNAVDFMHKLGHETPKVAVLSAVEKVNPKMQDTLDAAELKQRNTDGKLDGCIVEGPISFDLAIFPDSPVAGDADILLFPDITAGNIATKAMGFFGEPQNADIVLGFEVPVVFGSRGGPAMGKYTSIALSTLVASSK